MSVLGELEFINSPTLNLFMQKYNKNNSIYY